MSRNLLIGLLVGLLLVIGTTASAQDETASDETFLHWSPDGTQMAFLSNRNGIWDLYVMDAAGGEPRQLTENMRVYPWISWLPDGQSVLFSTGNNSYEPALFTVDVETRALTLLFGGDGFGYSLYSVSPDEQWLLVGRYKLADGRGNQTQACLLYNLKDKTVTEIPRLEKYGVCGLVTWSPDSTRLALSTSWTEDPERAELYIYDVAAESLSENLIAGHPYAFDSMGGLQWSPDSQQVLVNFFGDHMLYVFDIASGELLPLVDMGASLKNTLVWLDSGIILYATEGSPTDDVVDGMFTLAPDEDAPQVMVATSGVNVQLAPDDVHILVSGTFMPGEDDTDAPTQYKVFDITTGENWDIEFPPFTNIGALEWSPDSQLFGVALCVEDDFDLFVIDASTSAIRNLTTEDMFATSGASTCNMP